MHAGQNTWADTVVYSLDDRVSYSIPIKTQKHLNQSLVSMSGLFSSAKISDKFRELHAFSTLQVPINKHCDTEWYISTHTQVHSIVEH